MVSELCQDENSMCAAWARNGECTKNPMYMLNNCKKSCNNCPPIQTQKPVANTPRQTQKPVARTPATGFPKFRKMALKHAPYVFHPWYENPSGEGCDFMDANECKAAVEYMNKQPRNRNRQETYAGEVNSPNFPKGCYSLGTKQVFFNMHPEGKGARNANKICKQAPAELIFPGKGEFYKNRISSECKKLPFNQGADWYTNRFGEWVVKTERRQLQFTRPSMVSPPAKVSEDETDARHEHPEGVEGENLVPLLAFRTSPQHFSAFALAAHFEVPARLPGWTKSEHLAFSTKGAVEGILIRVGENEFECDHRSLPPGSKIKLLPGNAVELHSNGITKGTIDPFNNKIDWSNGTTWVLKV